MALTRDFGRFVADVSFERLPSEAIDITQVGFIDRVALTRQPYRFIERLVVLDSQKNRYLAGRSYRSDLQAASA